MVSERLVQFAFLLPVALGSFGGIAYAEHINPHVRSPRWRSGALVLAHRLWLLSGVTGALTFCGFAVWFPPYAFLQATVTVVFACSTPFVIAMLGWVGHSVGLHGLFDRMDAANRTVRRWELGRIALRLLVLMVAALALYAALLFLFSATLGPFAPTAPPLGAFLYPLTGFGARV